MPDTINTKGGPAIAGDVDTQSGDFVARDKLEQRNVIDINIPRESYEHIIALRQQIDKLDGQLNWKLALLERDLDQNKRDLLALRNDMTQMKAEGLFAKFLPLPSNETSVTKAEPITAVQLIIILGLTFIISIIVAFGLFYIIKM